MKHMLSLLLASLLSISLFATSDVNSDDFTFTIHIGAFVKAQSSDFAEIKPYGFLYAQRINNLLQIYMGDYPTEGEAMKVLEKVKRHNYSDAFITRRDLSKGKSTRVIQIATKQLGDNIDWQHYATAGNLFALLEGNTVKILTGPFTSVGESDDYLNRLKAAGFKDAFAKKVNSILLHQITEFEAGESLVSSNLYSLAVVPEKKEAAPPSKSLFVIPPKVEKKVEEPTSEKKEVLTARDAAIPESFDVVEKRIEPKPEIKEEVTPKAKPEAIVKSKSIVKPATYKIVPSKTRADVKRNSAYNLQLIMKSEGVYGNSLDGFYGPATKKGWEAIQQSNTQLKKYILLSGIQEKMTPRSSANILQHYINTIDENPEKAINGLKNSKEATAKAYRAYALFVNNGPGKEVNELMNAAVKTSFANKKLENKPPFDYTATYDYKNLDQLILHLRYIQGAASTRLEVPCWIFLKHPKEAQAAFEPYSEMSDDNYPVQDARPLFDWREFDLLETILTDLNTNTEKLQDDKTDQYLRSRLLLAPKPLSKDAHLSITQWNKNLWSKMDAWGAEDGLHAKLLIPFKATYFQTLVRLEDYFMDKGFDGRMATALGLSVMKTFVESPLSQY